MRAAARASVLALALVTSACAARRVTLPSDAGTPLPDFQQVHAAVSRNCAGIRTLTAELSLSGRAGGERLRGRVIAGFERPASMRLEGVAPFGPPAFILAARGQSATLFLPRDARVVRNARAEEILGALTGVTLAPADLQAILTGCVVPGPTPTAGRVHGNGWASVDLDGGATLFLQRRQGTWELRAARRGNWQIEYTAGTGTLPASVRLMSDMPAMVDLQAGIDQVEANIDLPAAAFEVDVPADADPLTIDELRSVGALRGQ